MQSQKQLNVRVNICQRFTSEKGCPYTYVYGWVFLLYTFYVYDYILVEHSKNGVISKGVPNVAELNSGIRA